MKPTTINVQITKTPKQYESIRLGMEATLDAGETVETAITAATQQLNAIYAEMYTNGTKVAQNAEKPATNASDAAAPELETLTASDKRVAQIIARMEKEPSKADEVLSKARKYYKFDADVEKILTAAAQLNKKLNK